MKKMLMKLMTKYGSTLAVLALVVAATASTRVCGFIYHQPKMPDEVKKLRKF